MRYTYMDMCIRWILMCNVFTHLWMCPPPSSSQIVLLNAAWSLLMDRQTLRMCWDVRMRACGWVGSRESATKRHCVLLDKFAEKLCFLSVRKWHECIMHKRRKGKELVDRGTVVSPSLLVEVGPLRLFPLLSFSPLPFHTFSPLLSLLPISLSISLSSFP